MAEREALIAAARERDELKAKLTEEKFERASSERISDDRRQLLTESMIAMHKALNERDSLRALLAKAEEAGAELLASREDLFRYKPAPKGPYTVKIPSDEQLRHEKAMHDFRAVLEEIRKAKP